MQIAASPFLSHCSRLLYSRRFQRGLTLGFTLASLLTMALPRSASAFACPNGGRAGLGCFLDDGRRGRTTCDDECIPTEGVPVPSGTVTPKYMVMTVIYAPPGSNGCMHQSNVSYGSGSTLGTSVSASKSFRWESEVKTSTGGGVLGKSEIGVSFKFGGSTVSNQEMTISKQSTTTINMSGPCRDGIDHDQDQIWLWLGPRLKVRLPNNEVQWSFESNAIVDIQWVTVGELKNPASMRPGVASQLARYGINGADYAAMLGADPFAFDPNAGYDRERYTPVNMTFPYRPASSGGSVSNLGHQMVTAMMQSHGMTRSHDYTVGMTVSGEASFFGVFNSKISASGSWTWSSTNSSSNSEGTQNSALVMVGSPSDGYTGPTSLYVLYDRIYKTFAFAPYF